MAEAERSPDPFPSEVHAGPTVGIRHGSTRRERPVSDLSPAGLERGLDCRNASRNRARRPRLVEFWPRCRAPTRCDAFSMRKFWVGPRRLSPPRAPATRSSRLAWSTRSGGPTSAWECRTQPSRTGAQRSRYASGSSVPSIRRRCIPSSFSATSATGRAAIARPKISTGVRSRVGSACWGAKAAKRSNPSPPVR